MSDAKTAAGLSCLLIILASVLRVVVFPVDEGARNALNAVRSGGVGAGWEEAPAAPRLGEESVVFTGRPGGEDAALAVFR